MTETKSDPLAAEEARVNALAAGDLHAQIYSDAPLRMTDDAYLAIVATGRRAVAGQADAAAVQAELDAVFGEGKVNASDVLAPPGGPVADDEDAETKPARKR